MRNSTAAFRRALAEDRRDYTLSATITLANNTVLNITNEDIWDGGFSIEDSVSNDNIFQLGAAIIGQATLVLNNIDDDYSDYDFGGALVEMYVGLEDLDDGTDETIKMGTYNVDEAKYNGSLITLICVDMMARFDAAYDTTLTYPASLSDIVRDACTKCGVVFNSSKSAIGFNYSVSTKPDAESCTYRQVISWAAQLCGCFARCDVNGKLVINHYDSAALDSEVAMLNGGVFDSADPYASGDTADGGSFNPWNTGYDFDAGTFEDSRVVHHITSTYSHDISVDDVVITGVKVVKKVVTEGSSDSYIEYTAGSEGYVVSVENNDLIQGDHGQDIADYIATIIVGMRFRKASVAHLSDPTIEAGDVALLWDTKDNIFAILVSSTTFTAGDRQNTVSSAETPRRNSAVMYSESTKNYVAMRKQLVDIDRKIEAAGGLYYTEVPQTGGGSIIYYHNKPLLADSNIIMSFSQTGSFLSDDGGTTWYGMTIDGQILADTLNANGVEANWIRTGTMEFDRCRGGTLSLGGDNNASGQLYAYTSDGRLFFKLTENGVDIYDDTAGALGGEIAVTNLGNQGMLIKDNHNYYYGRLIGVSNEGIIMSGGDGLWLQGRETLLFDLGTGSAGSITTDYMKFTSTGLYINKGISVQGNKSRVVETEDYGNRLLYCYETPSPMFGDVGEGVIGSDGKCYVTMDPVFSQTISTDQYQVFLQRYGSGDCYVAERKGSYFVVEGTPGLAFGWEIKAKQSDFDQYRLERHEQYASTTNRIDYAEDAATHLTGLVNGRLASA